MHGNKNNEFDAVLDSEPGDPFPPSVQKNGNPRALTCGDYVAEIEHRKRSEVLPQP